MDKVDFNKIGFRFKFPDECHMVLIFREGNSLCAVVSFYGGISTIFVELCKNYKGNIKKMNIEGYIYDIGALGYICDWKNKKEYTLMEYIDQI